MVCKQVRTFPLCQGLRYLKLSIKKVMCGMLIVPQKLFRSFKWTQNGNISLCQEKEIVTQYGSKIFWRHWMVNEASELLPDPRQRKL